MGAAMIKPSSDLMDFKVNGASIRTVEVSETDLNASAMFIRFTPRGVVLVRSYYEDDETLVETIIDGRQYRRWYKHGLITARAATLLVNRFFHDIDAGEDPLP